MVKEKRNAINDASYKCEVSNAHYTFTKNNGKDYIEAHHLIPMEYYFDKRFETNIDFSKNIFALCPNCHKKIHHSNDKDKKDLLTLLYNSRIEDLKKYYNLNLEILFELYNLKKFKE